MPETLTQPLILKDLPREAADSVWARGEARVAEKTPESLPSIVKRAQAGQGKLTPSEILRLQRTVGNKATIRLLSNASQRSSRGERPVSGEPENVTSQAAGPPAWLQTKLTVGAPDDVYEKEAEAVAEQVTNPAMQGQFTAGAGCPDEDARQNGSYAGRQALRSISRMPFAPAAEEATHRNAKAASSATPELQRKCACGGESEGECEDCRASRLQRLAEGDAAGMEAPPIVDEVLNAPGQPLAETARRALEPGFGHDFGKVRIHDDAQAGESAAAISAHAYTVGNHIVFSSGKYAPGTGDGNLLLAHELTHTIQQTGGSPTVSRADRERETTARRYALQRDPDPAPAPADPVPYGPPAPAPSLDQRYQTELANARQSGNWQAAAELLNAFNHEDIQTRLAQLSDKEVGFMHGGAVANPRVGPDSAIAKLTDPSVPRASTNPPNSTQTPPAPAPGATPTPTPGPGTPAASGPPCAATRDPSSCPNKPVPEMSSAEKLFCALDCARAARNGAMSAQIEGLQSKQNVFALIALAGLYAGAQLTPVGWVADALALTAVTITIFFKGMIVLQALEDVAKAANAVNAQTPEDIRAAGEAAADAVAIAGIALVMGLVEHAGRAVPPGRTPFNLGDAAGTETALTPDGQIVKVPPDTKGAHSSQMSTVEDPKGTTTDPSKTTDSTPPESKGATPAPTPKVAIVEEDVTSGPHGPDRPMTDVVARLWKEIDSKTGKPTPQGRWLSRPAAEAAVQGVDVSKMTPGQAYSVAIPDGAGEVVRAAGEYPPTNAPNSQMYNEIPTDRALVLRKGPNSVHSFPIGPEHPAYKVPAPTK